MYRIPLLYRTIAWLVFFAAIAFKTYTLHGADLASTEKLSSLYWIVILLGAAGLVLLWTCYKQRRLMFFLEGSLDALEQPVTTTDLKMRWVFVNKLTETLLAQHNLNKRSVIGKHCSNWQADICETENCGVHCLRNNKPRTNYTQEYPDSPSTYMQVDTAYIHDDKGKRIGHVEIVTNVDAAKQLKEVAAIIAPSSKSLSTLSSGMADNTMQISEKTQSVSASSEEMSSNMNSVASSMEEMSTNIMMLSTAAEEMTATINEIAQNTDKARDITEGAVSQAVNASNQVGTLGTSVEQIGKVVETITDISEQVNLLALNATIEAARAGDAGKGFAVVANEIKALAQQTSEATGAIKKQVEDVQSSTTGTVSEITQISGMVNDINDLVGAIATAVEEQTATSSEIAQNVNQASQSISEVSDNVSQSSMVAQEITKDISLVNNEIAEISGSSGRLNENAAELAELSNRLNMLA